MPNPGYPEYDEWLSDVDSKFQVGWVNIGHLGSLVLLNMVIMLTVQFKTIVKKIKICNFRRRQKKYMQDMLKQQQLKND